MASQLPVYTGFWHDQDHESIITGATLTLPARYADYLISFLAFLVTICATLFWTICSFGLHQWSIRDQDVDIVGLQHQVLLRNSASSLSTLREALKVALAWRREKVSGLWSRSLFILLPAFVVSIAAPIATIFVADIASRDAAQVPVLIKKGSCGHFKANETSQAATSAVSEKLVRDTINGRQYASSWYGDGQTSLTAQSIFSAVKVPYTGSTTTPCPWDNICVASEAFSVQTDLLNSHVVFGINAQPGQRIYLQKNVTCSPLKFREWTSLSEDGSYMEYKFGEAEMTYSYFVNTSRAGVGYMIDAFTAEVFPDIPVAPFDRNDSDLSLFFMSQNSIGYLEPSFDPWFSANGTYTKTYDGRKFVDSDRLVNVMGCIDRYRFCREDATTCSSWNGLSAVGTEVNEMGYSPWQVATARRMLHSAYWSDTFSSVAALGIGSLLAQDIVTGMSSSGLPPNQWQLEVARWFETSLAKMQGYIVEYAFNRLDPDGNISLNTTYDIPDEPAGIRAALEQQCSNQRIRSSGQVKSFSALGLFIVVVATMVLGIVALALEPCLALAQKGRISARKTARQSDEKLHLLRMTLEHANKESNVEEFWSESTLGVPVRRGGAEVERPVMEHGGLANYVAEQEVVMTKAEPK